MSVNEERDEETETDQKIAGKTNKTGDAKCERKKETNTQEETRTTTGTGEVKRIHFVFQ
jgi:hypothetical protein